MDSELSKKSIITTSIFILTIPLLVLGGVAFSTGYFSLTDRMVSGITDVFTQQGFSFNVVFLLFFSLIFYYLFKYQKDEYPATFIFRKILAISSVSAIIAGIIIFLYLAFIGTFSEFGGLAVIGYPIIFVITGVITSLILTVNLSQKTNLYFVAGLTPLFALIFLRFSEADSRWINIPLALIIGTLIAVLYKKIKTKKVV